MGRRQSLAESIKSMKIVSACFFASNDVFLLFLHLFVFNVSLIYIVFYVFADGGLISERSSKHTLKINSAEFV